MNRVDISKIIYREVRIFISFKVALISTYFIKAVIDQYNIIPVFSDFSIESFHQIQS